MTDDGSSEHTPGYATIHSAQWISWRPTIMPYNLYLYNVIAYSNIRLQSRNYSDNVKLHGPYLDKYLEWKKQLYNLQNFLH